MVTCSVAAVGLSFIGGLAQGRGTTITCEQALRLKCTASLAAAAAEGATAFSGTNYAARCGDVAGIATAVAAGAPIVAAADFGDAARAADTVGADAVRLVPVLVLLWRSKP